MEFQQLSQFLSGAEPYAGQHRVISVPQDDAQLVGVLPVRAGLGCLHRGDQCYTEPVLAHSCSPRMYSSSGVALRSTTSSRFAVSLAVRRASCTFTARARMSCCTFGSI